MIYVSKGISRVGNSISPVLPGTKYLHHNIIDLTEKLLQFRVGYPEYTQSGDGMIWHTAFGNHGASIEVDPLKIYNNAILVGEMRNNNYNKKGVGYTYEYGFDGEPQEAYNNIFIQIRDYLIERDADVSDGSQIFDGNLYYRYPSNPINPLFVSWDSGSSSQNFMTLADFISSQFF
jgi:hypothetical protein